MYNYNKSKFKKRIRIENKQLKWINKKRGISSAARYLDEIINFIKNMLACTKCLENNWKTKYDNGFIIATCQNCENEISFPTKGKDKSKIEKVGDPCRHCNCPVIFRESKFNESKLKKAYYYTGYFYCLKCKEMYMSEQFKVINRK